MHILSPERKYFMINLHERMLPTWAGVEPATSWSPVGRRIQLSHRGRQVGSLVLFSQNMSKSTTGFSLAPLETAFTLHRGNTVWPLRPFQLPVIIASNFTCSKVILSGSFYHGNTADPPARVKPPWVLNFNPSHSNPLPTGSGEGVRI